MVRDDETDHGPAPTPVQPPTTAAARRARRKQVQGTARLAAALGFNRRTVNKLRDRGAPESVDEAAWRRWCHLHGIRCPRAASTLDLGDLLGPVPHGTGPVEPAASAPSTAGAAGASTPPTGAPGHGIEAATSWAQVKNRRDAELKELQARKVQIEIDEQEHRLIDRDEVRRVLGCFALVMLNELVDLPARIVQALPDGFPAEQRRPVRRVTEKQIDALRGRISGSLRKQLRDLLSYDEDIAERAAAPAATDGEVADG